MRNENLNVNGLKRGVTRVTKSRLVLVLYLIRPRLGRWGEFSGPITERSKAKSKQSRITFNTQFKIAL